MAHDGDRGDDDDDGGAKVTTEAGPIVETPGDGGTPAKSIACQVGGLALCFGFEGSIADESENVLKATTANIELVAGKEGQGRGIDGRIVGLWVVGGGRAAESALVECAGLVEHGGSRLARRGKGLILLQPT